MDPLARLVAQALRLAPEIEEELRAAERRLRDEYGGQRVYIGAAPRDAKTRRVAAALAGGASVDSAAAAAGCTPRHAARLVGGFRS